MLLATVMAFLNMMIATAAMYLSVSSLQYHVSYNHYQQTKNQQRAWLALKHINFAPSTHCLIAVHANAWFIEQTEEWWENHACRQDSAYYIVMPISHFPEANYQEIILHIGKYAPVNLAAIVATPTLSLEDKKRNHSLLCPIKAIWYISP